MDYEDFYKLLEKELMEGLANKSNWTNELDFTKGLARTCVSNLRKGKSQPLDMKRAFFTCKQLGIDLAKVGFNKDIKEFVLTKDLTAKEAFDIYEKLLFVNISDAGNKYLEFKYRMVKR